MHRLRTLLGCLALAVAALACGLALSSCQAKATPTVTTTPALPGGRQPTPIPPPEPGKGFSVMAGAILKHPDWYEGQNVTLMGYFRGQDLMDEVVLDAPTDRIRDWVIKDATGALWVAYGDKLPFPSTSHEVWHVVRVAGEVAVRENGTPYLLPTSVDWEGLRLDYDVLPAGCLFAVHRFGGEDKLDHHVYWYDTRTVVLYDAKTGIKAGIRIRLREDEKWKRALAKTRFFDLPPQVGQECSGCTRYYVGAVNTKTGKPHFVTLYEGQLPEPLETVIAQMIEKTAEAKQVP